MEVITNDTLKLLRTRTVEGLVSCYNAIFYPTMQFPVHLLPVAQGLVDRRIDKLGVIIGPGSGKALHPDTPVLTIEGWKNIGDIKINELVKTPYNTYTKVIKVTKQPPALLYHIIFEDGRTVIAHEEHLWKVIDEDDPYYKLVTTSELFKSKNSYKIPLIEPVEFPEMETAFTPHTMGLVCGRMLHFPINRESLDLMLEALEEVKNPTIFYSLFFKEGKFHFPNFLQFMSIKQRFNFLKGFLTGRLNLFRRRGITYYSCRSKDKKILQGIQNIIWSLGGKAYIVLQKNKQNYHLLFQLDFPEGIINKEKITRYEQLCTNNPYKRTLRIESLRKFRPAMNSVCITVEDPEGMFITNGYVQTHNSQLLSILYPIWELGFDQTTTILNISAGEDLPKTFLSSAMSIIENNEAYKTIFPNVEPDYEKGWSVDKGMFLKGRNENIPDANYSAVGVTSSALTGKHAKIIILDDIHSQLNSATLEQCEKIASSYYKTIIGRADPTGARYIVSGRRWSMADVYQVLMSTNSWTFLTLPAVRDKEFELYYDVVVPDDAVNIFTEIGQNVA